ncbi:MAG: hypothetical protein ACJA0V_003635 [Planctomycetota bacterium]|jgi:hypothetical protein
MLPKPEEGKGGFHQATTDTDRIREWWQKWPRASIGIASGAAGIVCGDQDAKDGGPERFDQVSGLEPHGATFIAKTPGDGLHYIYAQPADGKPVGTLNGCWKGIDIKGEGGYFVAPNGIDGREWVDEDPTDAAADGEFVELQEPPRWLLSQLPRKHSDGSQLSKSNQPEEGYCEVEDAIHNSTSSDPLEVLHNGSTLDAARMALKVTGADPDGSYDYWLNVMMELNALGEEGRTLAMAWSLPSSSHKDDDYKKFATFSGVRGIGSLFHRAEDIQPDWRLDYELEAIHESHRVTFGEELQPIADRIIAQFQAPEEAKDAAKPKTLTGAIRAASDPRIEPIPRRYLFRHVRDKDGVALNSWTDGEGLIVRGEAGQLCAAGGAGKTMALIQMGISIVTGRPWLESFIPGAAHTNAMLRLTTQRFRICVRQFA